MLFITKLTSSLLLASCAPSCLLVLGQSIINGNKEKKDYPRQVVYGIQCLLDGDADPHADESIHPAAPRRVEGERIAASATACRSALAVDPVSSRSAQTDHPNHLRLLLLAPINCASF
ncbi:hypothetical protein SEVIR_2G034633v4 [Setaria viridis]